MTLADTIAADVTDAAVERLDAAYSGALKQMSAARARPAHMLSLSGIGRCTRRAAYALAGTPPSDQHPVREQKAANLGTILHDAMVPSLAAQLGATFELPVILKAAGLALPGRYDIYDLDNADLIDLKSVGEHRLSRVRRFGVFREHRVQGMAYALALYQAGLPVRTVTFLYVDRARGDHETISLPFTRANALKVIDRVSELKFAAISPDDAVRDPDGRRRRIGPGWSFECDDCPFLRRCWGPDAQPGQRDIAAHRPVDAAEVQAACAALVAARDAMNEAKLTMEFHRTRLSHAVPTTYGKYKITPDRGSMRPDQVAMAARLEELGEQVPRARSKPTIKVDIVKETKPKAAKGGGGR